MSLAVKAAAAVIVNCVVEEVQRNTAPVVVFMHTTNGAEGNAVPLKLITPVVATPPVPTFTDPARGVLPAVTPGVVPKPEETVGRASTLITDPTVTPPFESCTKPFAVLRKSYCELLMLAFAAGESVAEKLIEVVVTTPPLVTVIGYVAAPPLMIDPNFNVELVVPATVAGKFSRNQESVSLATPTEFHAAPVNRSRGLICTGMAAVDSVVF